MAATVNQIKFCNDLIDAGAPFELDMGHENSVKEADAFIKKNYSYCRKTERYSRVVCNNSVMRPEDYDIHNH